jgi:hypothetical protein
MGKFPERFKVSVTDHAVVRWLEGIRGENLDHVREEILAEGRRGWVAQGAVAVRVPALQAVLVAERGTVITIHSLKAHPTAARARP